MRDLSTVASVWGPGACMLQSSSDGKAKHGPWNRVHAGLGTQHLLQAKPAGAEAGNGPVCWRCHLNPRKWGSYGVGRARHGRYKVLDGYFRKINFIIYTGNNFPPLIDLHVLYHTSDTRCPTQPPNSMNYADKVSVSTTQQISTPSSELLIWDSTCSATPVSWTGLSGSSTH